MSNVDDDWCDLLSRMGISLKCLLDRTDLKDTAVSVDSAPNSSSSGSSNAPTPLSDGTSTISASNLPALKCDTPRAR